MGTNDTIVENIITVILTEIKIKNIDVHLNSCSRQCEGELHYYQGAVHTLQY